MNRFFAQLIIRQLSQNVHKHSPGWLTVVQRILHPSRQGRVIWRNIGAIDWFKAKEMNRFLPFKLRAMNLFAERLFKGAG